MFVALKVARKIATCNVALTWALLKSCGKTQLRERSHCVTAETHKELKTLMGFWLQNVIDHFTVVCSASWPLNGSEAGGDTDLAAFVL